MGTVFENVEFQLPCVEQTCLYECLIDGSSEALFGLWEVDMFGRGRRWLITDVAGQPLKASFAADLLESETAHHFAVAFKTEAQAVRIGQELRNLVQGMTPRLLVEKEALKLFDLLEGPYAASTLPPNRSLLLHGYQLLERSRKLWDGAPTAPVAAFPVPAASAERSTQPGADPLRFQPPQLGQPYSGEQLITWDDAIPIGVWEVELAGTRLYLITDFEGEVIEAQRRTEDGGLGDTFAASFRAKAATLKLYHKILRGQPAVTRHCVLLGYELIERASAKLQQRTGA